MSKRLLGLAGIEGLVKIMNTEQKAAKVLFIWPCLDYSILNTICQTLAAAIDFSFLKALEIL